MKTFVGGRPVAQATAAVAWNRRPAPPAAMIALAESMGALPLSFAPRHGGLVRAVA
jgi:hypothetical protein